MGTLMLEERADEAPTPGGSDGTAAAQAEEILADRLIERMFFAYRAFVAGPDRALAAYGFGRAHHRVLHFVHRRPGLTVAELLGILQITKQSVARVLRDLTEAGHIVMEPGAQDRRRRQLSCTPAGKALAQALAADQRARLAAALRAVGHRHGEAVEAFLAALERGA